MSLSYMALILTTSVTTGSLVNLFLLVIVKPIPLNNVLMDASVHHIIDKSDKVSYFQYYIAQKVKSVLLISQSQSIFCKILVSYKVSGHKCSAESTFTCAVGSK